MSYLKVPPGCGSPGSSGGGWWPPGNGEPGTDWDYAPADLRLVLDHGELNIDVHVETPAGPRALCSVPVTAILTLIAARWQVEHE